MWICSNANKLWYVDEKPDLSLPHSIEVCDGSCANPLHRGSTLFIEHCVLAGLDWYEASQLFDAYERSLLSSSARSELEAKETARIAAQAKAEAEEARLAPMLALHNAQMDVMHRHAMSSRYKSNVGRKECAPCRSLYDWQRDRKCCGTNYISSDCWSHEFVDGLTSEFINETTGSLLPLAGKYGIQNAIKNKGASIVRKNEKFVLLWSPHNCWMLHPGEQGWLKEWEHNRKFTAQPSNRFAGLNDMKHHSPFHHRATVQTNPRVTQRSYPTSNPQPKPAPKPITKSAPKSNNVFAAFDSDSE